MDDLSGKLPHCGQTLRLKQLVLLLENFIVPLAECGKHAVVFPGQKRDLVFIRGFDLQTLIKIPVGDRPEVLIKGNASLLNRSNYSKGYIEETVNCTTLDKSFLSISTDSTVCAWIDVEGHFRAVHQGGSATFSRLDALYVEVEDHCYWEGQALTSEVYSMMNGSGMVAIARDREYDLQHNVIFIREYLTERIKPMLDEFFEKLAILSNTSSHV